MNSGSSPNPLVSARLRKGPYGVLLHGAPRTLLLRAAYAFSRANDPNFFWVDVRDANESVVPPGPVELGWIPADHLFVVSRAEAQPREGVSDRTLWTVIRSDEPQSVVGGLTDFLRLPPALQGALSAYGHEDQRPLFVIANADRVRAHYPPTVQGVRTFVDSMIRAGVVPVFASVSPSGLSRFACDLVLEVRAPDLEHWREGTLRCEASFPGAPFQPGPAMRLDSIPSLEAALQGPSATSMPSH